jgi:hypothetical protein
LKQCRSNEHGNHLGRRHGTNTGIATKEPLYLHRDTVASRLCRFLYLHSASFQSRVKGDFVCRVFRKEGGVSGRLPVQEGFRKVTNAADHYEHRKMADGFVAPSLIIWTMLDIIEHFRITRTRV